MPREDFYVVVKGRQTGIFMTWAECSAQVLQHPNAVHKKLPTLEEAKDFYYRGLVADVSQSNADTWENQVLPPIWFDKLSEDEQAQWTRLKREYALVVQEATVHTKVALASYQRALRAEARQTPTVAVSIARNTYEKADESQSVIERAQRKKLFQWLREHQAPEPPQDPLDDLDRQLEVLSLAVPDGQATTDASLSSLL